MRFSRDGGFFSYRIAFINGPLLDSHCSFPGPSSAGPDFPSLFFKFFHLSSPPPKRFFPWIRIFFFLPGAFFLVFAPLLRFSLYTGFNIEIFIFLLGSATPLVHLFFLVGVSFPLSFPRLFPCRSSLRLIPPEV